MRITCITLILILSIVILYLLLVIEVNPDKISIYYINLENSKDRDKYIKNHFSSFVEKTGFKLNRINAITPGDSVLRNNEYKFNQCKNFKYKTELAVLLSHIKSIHTAYHDKMEMAYIFEDDTIIHRIPNTFNLVNLAPRNWELLQLFTTKMFYDTKRLWLPINNEHFITASAYIINRQGMRKILSLFTENGLYNLDFDKIKIKQSNLINQHCVSDIILYKYLNSYLLTDLLFTVKTDNSTIHTEHLVEQKYNINKILEYFINGYKNELIGFAS